ncbi:MAG: hypothetical protein WAU78_06740 [Roseiarcus sp.]
MKVKSLILLAVGLSLIASTPSWALRTSTGARHDCRVLVNDKGLKGAARQAEYDRCMVVGAANYK